MTAESELPGMTTPSPDFVKRLVKSSGGIYLRQGLFLLPLVIAVALAELVLGYAVYPWLAIIHSPAGNSEAAVAALMLAVKLGVAFIAICPALLFSIPFSSVNKHRSGSLRTTGLYALSRHPVYMSTVLFMFPGFGIMLNNWLLAATLAVASLIYYLPHIRLEEEFLVNKYGDLYRQYQRNVGLLFSLGRTVK